jgi:basic membrane protein A
MALCAALALGIAACGDDDDDGGGGGGGGGGGEAAIKAGVVTDIGGLNDRSFNALANKGRKDAQSQLGVETRVLLSGSSWRTPRTPSRASSRTQTSRSWTSPPPR